MPTATLKRTKFTVDEFVKMVDANVFGSTKVELIDGRVYRMVQKEPHLWAVSKAMEVLVKAKRPTDWVMCQGTIQLDLYTMPDPDFLWLACPMGTPVSEWPKPLLLLEISSTTYKIDSGIKLRKYAFHGVTDYWIVNLNERRIEVCREPKNPTGRLKDCHYASVTHHSAADRIALLQRPDVRIGADELLP